MQTTPYDRAPIVATVDPANINNSTALSDAVDMSLWHEALWTILLGAVDAAITAKLVESATSGGTYTDITAKAITAFAGTDDNKQAAINLKSQDMGAGMRFAKLSITSGNGTTNLVACLCQGMKPRNAPVTADDLASVAEIVA